MYMKTRKRVDGKRGKCPAGRRFHAGSTLRPGRACSPGPAFANAGAGATQKRRLRSDKVGYARVGSLMICLQWTEWTAGTEAFARGRFHAGNALRRFATVTDRRYTGRRELDFQRREYSRLFPPFPPLTAFGESLFILSFDPEGEAGRVRRVPRPSVALPTTSRRYSRLQACATTEMRCPELQCRHGGVCTRAPGRFCKTKHFVGRLRLLPSACGRILPGKCG
jgi:hypothetical protein